MKGEIEGIIIGISIGVTIGAAFATCTLLCIRLHRRHAKVEGSSSDQRILSLPIRCNGIESSVMLSDSTIGRESPPASKESVLISWWRGQKKNLLASVSGIPRYPYKDLQKATHNFTTVIGQGAFGPVYKATMATGETVAVKALATNSKQGEREFQTEVLLLGRLHHRNLVNLVGYCVEKGHRMLIYEFMSNGSLAAHLYDENAEPLNWERRVRIAQDVSRGIEYLHDGAVPSVVHRDIKSANILLDQSMRARVADFGLSKEEDFDSHVSGITGTYGYLDPEYLSTKTFTKKSDIYSFGILLFELISARNPQQGLMEYVDLAAISVEGKSGWEEILDSRLNGKYNLEEARAMAALAYKCVHKSPKKRPIMRDVAQAISRLGKQKYTNKHGKQALPFTVDDNSEVEEQIEYPKVGLSNKSVTVEGNSETQQQIELPKIKIEHNGCQICFYAQYSKTSRGMFFKIFCCIDLYSHAAHGRKCLIVGTKINSGHIKHYFVFFHVQFINSLFFKIKIFEKSQGSLWSLLQSKGPGGFTFLANVPCTVIKRLVRSCLL